MDMYSLIDKKKNNLKLTAEELRYIVNGYTDGSIPDYQMAAFLMAVCFNGMSDEETYQFTIAMRDTGEILDLSKIKGTVVDKHSTGGVGDKVSLVLGPMVAACGVPVAKMSGRGLGHTGGTIDKLESFAGFNTSPDIKEFMKNVNDIGIAWAGQTANLAPADKKIYALRDVTATVDSMPLIASSIMSKKLASGAAGIVLDVTYGSGAFMRTPKEAEELAELMIKIGRMEGRSMSAVITNMEEPLGCAVGNSIEVIEAIEVLRGEGPKQVYEVTEALGSHMLIMSGKCRSMDEAKAMLRRTIEEKTALDKMAQWVERQGGDSRMVYDTSLFERARIEKKVIYKNAEKNKGTEKEKNLQRNAEKAKKYISGIDGKAVGMAVAQLGGGRRKKDDRIDLSVGVRLLKKTGDTVEDGDIIAVIYGNSMEAADAAQCMIEEAYSYSGKYIQSPQPIYSEID